MKNDILSDNLGLRTLLDEFTTEEIETLLNRKREEMGRKETLSKYPIKQLPNQGKYWVRYDGKQFFRKNKTDLENLILELDKPKKITIVTIFDEFLKQRKTEVASTTWAYDKRYFDWYIKESKMGNKPISELEIADGYEFFDEVKAKKSDLREKYWSNLKSSLDMIMKYCIQKGYIKLNPFDGMSIHQDNFAPQIETPIEDTVFSKEEQAEICRLSELDAEINGSGIPLAIPLLFNTGLRDGEITASRWCDIVDIEGQKHLFIRRIQVGTVNDDGMVRGRETAERCKSKRSKRKVPLNSKAIEILDKIKEYNQNNGYPTSADDYIFLRMYKGDIVECTERCFAGRLTKYCKQVGMVQKSPHDIRRTALTNLWLNGVPIKIIQMIAGHNSQKQTEDYLRITEKDILHNKYMETLVENTTKNFQKSAEFSDSEVKNEPKSDNVVGKSSKNNIIRFRKKSEMSRV